MATLKLCGTQVSTAPTASSLLPSYKDGHAYSTPVGGTNVPGRHSASARLKPLAFGWRDGLLYPPLISWLQREEARAQLVEELGELSVLSYLLGLLCLPRVPGKKKNPLCRETPCRP